MSFSERPLMDRMNRMLSKKNMQLKKCHKSSKRLADLGQFYIVDTRGAIIRTHVNLFDLEREFKLCN